MSRPTDTERGARMAYEMAESAIDSTHFFPLSPDELTQWKAIQSAANEQLRECAALREALHG